MEISSFALLIQRDYGPDVAEEFRGRFAQQSGQISFQAGMDMLDSILSCDPAPRPSFGTIGLKLRVGSLKIRN